MKKAVISAVLAATLAIASISSASAADSSDVAAGLIVGGLLSAVLSQSQSPVSPGGYTYGPPAYTAPATVYAPAYYGTPAYYTAPTYLNYQPQHFRVKPRYHYHRHYHGYY